MTIILYVSGHLVEVDENFVDRFWKKVTKTDSCWLWNRAVNTHGYGQVALPSRATSPNRLFARAHRVSWQIARGPLGFNQCVLHRCDRPACVNPGHLFLGTQLDNIADMHQKGRASGGRSGRPGELHPMAKLSSEEVSAIRMAAGEGESYRSISERFYISKSQAYRIATRKRWSHT